MKKTVVAVVLSSLALSVIAQDGQGTESIYATYVCKNKMDYKIDVEFDNKKDVVNITYKDQTITIPAALSADGARYTNDKSEYWFKGDNLLINGKTKCHTTDS